MGLTIHYKLAAPASCDEAAAGKIVASLHRLATRFVHEGLADEVLPVTSDANTLRRFACDWLILPVPNEENTSTGAEIPPLAGFIFPVNIGADCEPLWLGLCRYPATVNFHGKKLATKRGDGWQLAGFCKTQFASLHGWEHFQRCHCAVVELLATSRTAGLRVKINDEGSYWPRRSMKTLRRNLDHLNGLVAATAGALKDNAADGTRAVQSPIFAHKNFEHLEAAGTAHVTPLLEKIRAIIKKK